MYEKITSENVMMFAIKHYDNRHLGGEQEFFDDLKRIKYIKRLFKRYLDTGELRERLLLNHFIVLKNMFGADAAITLLLFKIEREYWSLLKTFLVFLNMLKDGELSDIEINDTVLNKLKEI
tara:strand:- start:1668 stop:2030 length:363 start_codon:yes stop_codon:yes gene_type:complete